MLRYQSWDLPTLTPQRWHTNLADPLRALLTSVLVFGLYPEAVTAARKQNYLLNLAHDYVLKDIFQLGLTRSPEVLHKLLQLLAYQVGSEVSQSELATTLGISRSSDMIIESIPTLSVGSPAGLTSPLPTARHPVNQVC